LESCASRGRVAEWPVTDPVLPVLVLIQDNATAKSIARMRRGESGRRRPFRQDPVSGKPKSEGRIHCFRVVDACPRRWL